ncbi:diguanylate cyclase [Bacillus coahuilensis]
MTSLIFFSMIFLTIGYILFFVSETHIKTLVDLERKEAESVTDHLTGLQNRRSLDRMIYQIIADIQNGDETMYSVILFDVDYFKQFNDTYGHISGDEILWQMSRLVENHLEDQEHITLYRYGGEEFCIVMKSVPHKEAKRVAEKIRELVETANFYIPAKKEIHLTISLGVASYPETTDELSDVLSCADKFLYRAKRNGRNCSFGEQEEELLYV